MTCGGTIELAADPPAAAGAECMSAPGTLGAGALGDAALGDLDTAAEACTLGAPEVAAAGLLWTAGEDTAGNFVDAAVAGL